MSTIASQKTVAIRVISDGLSIEEIKQCSRLLLMKPNGSEYPESENKIQSRVKSTAYGLQDCDDSVLSFQSGDINKSEMVSVNDEIAGCSKSPAGTPLPKTDGRSSKRNTFPAFDEANKYNSDKTLRDGSQSTDKPLLCANAISDKPVRSYKRKAIINKKPSDRRKKRSKMLAVRSVPSGLVLVTKVVEGVLPVDNMSASAIIKRRCHVRVQEITESASISEIVSVFGDDPDYVIGSELNQSSEESRKHHRRASSQNSNSLRKTSPKVFDTVAEVHREAENQICTVVNNSDKSPPASPSSKCFSVVTASGEHISSSFTNVINEILDIPKTASSLSADLAGCEPVADSVNGHGIEIDVASPKIPEVTANHEQLVVEDSELSIQTLSSSSRTSVSTPTKKARFATSGSKEVRSPRERTKVSVNEESTSVKEVIQSVAVHANEPVDIPAKKSGAARRKQSVLRSIQRNKIYQVSAAQEKMTRAVSLSVLAKIPSHKMHQKLCDSSHLAAASPTASAPPSSSSHTTTPAYVDTKSRENSASHKCVIIPPPEHVHFTQSGDVQFSDVIMKAIPELVKSGSTDIYLHLNKVTKPSSSTEQRIVLKVDLSSDPIKFTPTAYAPPSERLQKNKPLSQVASRESLKQAAPSKKTPHRDQLTILDISKKLSHTENVLPANNDDILGKAVSIDYTGIDYTNQDTPSQREGKSDIQDNGRLQPATSDPAQVPENMAATEVPVASSDKMAFSSPAKHWTCEDVSRWLSCHGLGRFTKDFAGVDGHILAELVHCFNKDLEILQNYLHDLGFCFFEKLKLYGFLRALCKQTREEAEPTVHKDEGTSSTRSDPTTISGSTCLPEVPSASGDQGTFSSPISQWTCDSVCQWLTCHGLARFVQEFSNVDGQGLVELFHCFNADPKTVHKTLYNMGFTLSENLKLCAFLRAPS